MKHDTTQTDSTGVGIDTTAFNGLSDTTNNSATATNNASQHSSATNNSVASTGTSSVTNTDAGAVAATSSTGKTMARDVENSSTAKHHRGGSYSIYDGINDQEERYVVRKAEGYNDAYYIDDYNGSNKFYEDHYKKASTLEKPEAEYIDKSINLPTAAYANGPTQKTADAQIPKVADDAPKPSPAKVDGTTGTIGISKKTLIEQSKKAKDKK